MHVYLNGRIIPDSDATVSVHDHGFLYGAGFFETFRTYRGRPFLLEQHLERLRAGCAGFHIRLPETSPSRPGRMEPILARLLEANGLPDAVFRFTVSAGTIRRGLPETGYTVPTELLVPRALPQPRARPLALHLLRRPRNSPEFEPRPKSLAYMNSLAGHLEMREREIPSGDEGLMLTPGGLLSEGVTSNLFFLRDGHLHTPALANHILPGVTRAAVLALAAQGGIPAREGDFTVDDLTAADAVFLTNSVRGLSPADAVHGTDGCCLWRAGPAPDPVFEELQRAYTAALP